MCKLISKSSGSTLFGRNDGLSTKLV